MAIPKVPVLSDDMIKAIHAKKGVVKHAAALIGCDDATIFKRAHLDPDVEKAIREARAAREVYDLDDDIVVASKSRRSLHRLLDADNVTAAIFVAKTKAKFEGDGYDGGAKITLRIDNK